jgi:hypothetical protein
MQDSGEDEGEKVAGAVRLRQQMSLYSLPYLMAWYAGWRAHAPASLKLPPIPSKRMGDREYLLDVIVDKQLDWSRDHKTEAGRTKEMSKCFSEHNEGAPNPIMLQAEIDDAEDSSESEESEPGDQASTIASTAKPSKKALDPKIHVASSAGHKAPPQRKCSCCAEPTAETAATFRCLVCGLRGDVGLEDPVNVHLLAIINRAPGAMLKPDHNEKKFKDDPSSGQSSAHAPPAASRLSALDSEFARLATTSPPFSTFAAGSACTADEALNMSHAALDAAQSQRPSESLVRLIQSGKLVQLGYALPRPLSCIGIGAQGPLTVEVEHSTGAVMARQAPVPAAPSIDSPQKLAMALVSTILPALVERPRAIAAWCSLARTMFTIGESRVGWEGAMRYATAHLTDAARSDTPMERVDSSIINSLHWAALSAGPGGAQGPSTGSVPAAAGRQNHAPIMAPRGASNNEDSTCRRFNAGHCDFGDACRFSHSCLLCGAQGHGRSSCRGSPGSVTPRAVKFQGKRGGGRG